MGQIWYFDLFQSGLCAKSIQIWHFDPLTSLRPSLKRVFTPLLFVLVLPNYSKLVAALYLGLNMKSLWAYIEGLVGLFLPFISTNSSDLALYRPSSKFEACLLILYVLWCSLILLLL